MGYAVATIRLMMIKAQRLDLEYKLQVIADAKMNLSRTVTDLMSVGTDLDPDSPVLKKLEQRKERLYLIEKKLDLQMEQYRLKLQALEAEEQSCKQMISKNIKESFSY
ncbi:hypothetical protein IJE86_10255 [bacterium]|nr:hypothetical protein [bacterium]